MFVQQTAEGRVRLMTSASDLTAASACEFAFLRRVDARLGRDVMVPPDDDPMLARAAMLGDAHEERVLRAYTSQFGGSAAGAAGGVVEIARADSRDEAALAAAQHETLRALLGGAEVVFQATFFDPSQRAETEADPAIGFIGYADFLRRMPDGAYEVQDTKLARKAKVTALMQLAAYAEQLERLGVPVSPEVVLILGDGARSRHRLADIAPVFRARRERLHEILLERARERGADGRLESAAPIEWGAAQLRACGRCEVCAPEIERTRDPLLIAGIRSTQRDRLIAAGYDTIEKIADALPAILGETVHVEKMTKPVLERLAWQADLQRRAVPGEPPPVQVIDPQVLSALPVPNEGDLFFDFEGDPLYGEPGDNGSTRWGIDYLFGMIDSNERFTAFWAHDLQAEKQALQEFLAMVAARRRRYPGMHIYHYAPYERTHLLSIAARHGVGEDEVDELLREHVLVDLYPIVRGALRIGTRSYSIKKLEPLYMGDELRDEDGVTSGAQSVTEYAEASALLQSGSAQQRAEGQRRLDGIADYNRYDCVSTLRLRDWLRSLAADAPVRSIQQNVTPRDDEEAPMSGIGQALAMHAALAPTSAERMVIELAASATDYHRRERKSYWWAHFARLVGPIEDWADTRDVVVVDASASVIESDWFRLPRGRVDRREVRLVGEVAPGSSLKPGGQAFAVYAQPAPFDQPGAAPGARVARLVTILEVHDDGVTIGETLPQDTRGYHVLPLAITPGAPPNPGHQPGAIQEWAKQLVASLDAGSPFLDPVIDIMRRDPPRCLAPGGARLSFDAVSGAHLEGAPSDGAAMPSAIEAVAQTLRRLYLSSLAVQGPPGTGKTYLAAHVIKTLVERDGWHIGVVAQSHKVVENVLDGVISAGLDRSRVAKAPQAGMTKEQVAQLRFRPLRRGEHTGFLREHREHGQGAVIGGTAWDFSNSEKIGRRELDLLVVDEAGQFSLAPTIAVSVSAQRLLLLGDPQQLPQVSQGSHPAPVQVSALGWLLGEHETIPETLGYFLAETRRMRPELAEVVSELSYEGRLRAHPSAAQREVDGAGPAGLVWHPVEHEGNSTSSIEEAEEVVRIAQRALGGSIREPGEQARPLREEDVIVVAAYNAQVECLDEALAEAGLERIRVGTVDKFQGQEAAIAIVSLAASSGDDVPRGLEFLLLRNRLNVAISRAQWAAHLVSSPELGRSLPNTAEGVAALSGYLRLTERSAG